MGAFAPIFYYKSGAVRSISELEIVSVLFPEMLKVSTSLISQVTTPSNIMVNDIRSRNGANCSVFLELYFQTGS